MRATTVRIAVPVLVMVGTLIVGVRAILASVGPTRVCPPITAWKGEYWANPELSGPPTLCRNDLALDFDWEDGSPDPAIPSDRFSARWTRSLSFNAGTYRFEVFHDDGARFYIDDAPVLDNWCLDCVVTDVVTRGLSAGSHNLKLEMYENAGAAGARLDWTAICYSLSTSVSPSGAGGISVNPGPNCGSQYSAGTVVQLTANANSGYRFNSWSGDASGASNPITITMDGNKNVTANLSGVCPPITEWKGEYWINPDLSGPPTFCWNDIALDFDWGNGSPDPAIPSDHFSARWTRASSFDAAPYRFEIFHDDGARFYIDDVLVLDNWCSGCAVTDVVTRGLSAGSHNLKLEMYENSGAAGARLNWKATCFSLSTDVSPSGAGSVSANPGPNCGSLYSVDTVVQLTANANSGYSFSSWSGGASGASNPTSITMDGNKSVTASYRQCYSLSTNVSPSGAGSISVNPGPNCGSQYSAGTVVQLTANANSGYSFSSWSGGASGTSNPISITMNGAKNITANWGVCPPITGWKGEYWTNSELSGPPTLCRNDVALDFDWGNGSPDPAIPSDHFSARWTRSVFFDAGAYRFDVLHDDGARFYIDDVLALDNWCSGCIVTDAVIRELGAGNHNLKLEIYENVSTARARLDWIRVRLVHLPAVMR